MSAWVSRLAIAVGLVSGAALPPSSPFVDIATVAPTIAVDIRYAGTRNFLGRPARGYAAPRCLLTRPAAAALAKVAEDLAPFGLGLKVYDCYRPRRAVDDFMAWTREPGESADQAAYHPAVAKSQLVARGYIAPRSGHSRGSTIDMTIAVRDPGSVPRPPRRARASEARPPPRDCRRPADDGSLDMGTTFDCFDETARATYAGLSPEVRRNRLLLRLAMERRGFVAYEPEWWHFTLADEPFATESFDLEIR
jgi:D-alanyl-D-alanine dipeptidase